MTKREICISLCIISFVVIGSSLWLMQEHKISDDTISAMEVVQEKSPNSKPTIIEDTNNDIIFEDKDSLKLPKFVLTATVMNAQNSEALMAVNKKEPQWFRIGDNVIDSYSIHGINNSLVTLFDGSGAYYEISLFEPQL